MADIVDLNGWKSHVSGLSEWKRQNVTPEAVQKLAEKRAGGQSGDPVENTWRALNELADHDCCAKTRMIARELANSY